jgi:putative spermidine/putrescine transport system substrate-binding protein
MQAYSRRDVMRAMAMMSASIGAVEAGMLKPARAERDFIWASTGGAWGEHLNSIFIQQGNFAAEAKVTPTPSFQLESIASSKILVANGNPPYDVSNHGQAEVTVLQKAGLLLPYKVALMPNYADVHDTAKMGDFYASTSFLLFGLSWNTKLIAKAPTSFDALLAPDLKGKVGVPAFGWYGMYWLHGLNKALGGNEDNMDPGMKFATELVRKNSAVIVENADHARKLFQQEEIIMSPFWNGISAQLQKTNVPVKFEAVPGTLAIGTGFVVLKGTPYEEAANKLVNNTLDPKLQVAFSSWNMYPPTNRRAVLPPELDNIRVTEAQLANTVALDWTKVADRRAEYLKRWNEEVLG